MINQQLHPSLTIIISQLRGKLGDSITNTACANTVRTFNYEQHYF